MTNTPATRPGIKRFIGVDFDVGALGSAGRQYWSFVAVLAIIAGLGVTAWIIFMTQGAGVMAQRDNFTWGMWFSNYMYYVGLSAGGLIVYASVHLFGAEQFRPLARLAVLQAGVLVMLALLGDLTDLIRPWRTYQFLTRPNISAIFIYTGSAAAAYMVLTFFDLWVLITGKGGEKLAKRLTLVALPFAIYLHTTTAFVLSLNKSRELWNSAVMVPIFLTSAIASGIALLLISAYIMQHFGVMKFKSSMFRSLSTLLATVIISDLFLLVVEVITVFWPTSAKTGHVDRMALFINGPYAWMFIPVFVLGIGAFALLAGTKTRHLPAIQITASAMYVVGIFFKRYTLMSMGFAIGPLGQYQPPYLPSFVEVFFWLGLLAIGLLFMTIGAKILPLKVPEEELARHASSHAEVAPKRASEAG